MFDDPKILVIEDDLEIRRFLRVSLMSHGYQLVESATGRDGLAQLADEKPDVILLDLGLPDTDGLSLIRQLRALTSAPVLVVSARGHEADKVKALDAGADDYLTKPFSVKELLARIRAALRRVARSDGQLAEPVFTLRTLRVDFDRRLVSVADKPVHLTPIEFRLLASLIRYQGKAITHRQLLQEVWGPDCVFETHYLRVYMAHLRRKIEADPVQPRFLITEPGVGYRLAAQ